MVFFFTAKTGIAKLIFAALKLQTHLIIFFFKTYNIEYKIT